MDYSVNTLQLTKILLKNVIFAHSLLENETLIAGI